MKKKRSYLNYAIFYKDHHYEMVREDKLNPRKLSSNEIKLILVPCLDRENCYIPMKPSGVYDFKKAHVLIRYNTFSLEWDHGYGTEMAESVFEADCKDLIELGNALFNLYKFRGSSIFIDENNAMDSYLAVSMNIYPLKIRIDFYGECGERFAKIESKEMHKLSTINSSRFAAFPPAYCCEDRFYCIEDIMFVPLQNPYRKYEPGSDGLPPLIRIDEDYTWTDLYQNKKVHEDDFIFYKLPDFGAYYLMPPDMLQALEEAHFTTWEVKFQSIPICQNDKVYFPHKPEKPTAKEKIELYTDYEDDNLYGIIPVEFSIQNITDFITIYAFANVIIGYLNYFTLLAYELDHVEDALGFMVFNDIKAQSRDPTSFNPRTMLVDFELNPDTLAKTILYLMERK